MHRPREEVSVLTQHIGHHESRQLRIGVGVKQTIVRQRMEGITGLVLHEVQQRGVGMVWGCDGRNLIVFVPSSSSTATITPSSLTGEALKRGEK